MREKRLILRMTEQEKVEVEAKAKTLGLTISAFIRMLIKTYKS